MYSHQEAVNCNASCDFQVISRELADHVGDIAKNASDSEDHTLDVRVHGKFDELSLVFLEELHIILG